MDKISELLKTFVKRFFIFYLIYSMFSYGAHWLLGTEFSVSKCLWMGTMISLISLAYEWVLPKITKS
jgi:hypothetical protein